MNEGHGKSSIPQLWMKDSTKLIYLHFERRTAQIGQIQYTPTKKEDIVIKYTPTKKERHG